MLRKAALLPKRLLRRTISTRSRLQGGGHGGPEPKGLLAKIQSKDEYLVLATFGGVASVIFLNKLLSGGKKAPEPAPSSSSSSSDGGIPSFTDPSFAEWVGKEGNFEKLFAQLDG
mmetsp:Transcript_4480/g.6915  ORF Transcript_4480/g.6915 Transcript_4480/m.6915 type:complete len:115 (+) Transcript_4480:126-470(+)|eukprot:jgi/Bigna1/85954/estExt_fgenesh1_pg.C_70095